MTKLLLALMAAATVASAADPFLGSWKPNLEKSRLSPEELERRKVEVLTVESAGKDTYHIVLSRPDGRTADTKRFVWIIDGKEHQEKRSGLVGTIKVERISEWHLRTTSRFADRAIVYDWAVTADGKTLTSTPKSNPDEFFVYSKQ